MSTTASPSTTPRADAAASSAAAGPSVTHTGTRFTRVLGALTLLSLAATALFGLVLSPKDVIQHDAVRLLYLHVGTIWIAYVAFVVTALCSIAYLWKRTTSLTWDRIAGASAEIGVVFMAGTLVVGAMWGRLTWGHYWLWDPRVTTTAFMFITYVGYLAVRGLGGTHQQRARRSAVVALLAVLEIPLVHYSVKWWRSVHQDPTLSDRTHVELSGLMLFTLMLAVVAFSLLYVWWLLHRQRVLAMLDALDDHGLDLALAERRVEAATAVATASDDGTVA